MIIDIKQFKSDAGQYVFDPNSKSIEDPSKDHSTHSLTRAKAIAESIIEAINKQKVSLPESEIDNIYTTVSNGLLNGQDPTTLIDQVAADINIKAGFDSLNKLSVCVVNLGRYNEGHNAECWMELPVSDTELDRLLSEKLNLELNPAKAHEKATAGEAVYESYAVHDQTPEGLFKNIDFGEYVNLHDLNLVAKSAQNLSPEQTEAMIAFIRTNNFTNPLELANVIAQVDEIGYIPFDFQGMENGRFTPNEKLAYTYFEGNEITKQLETIRVGNCSAYSYIDMEALGRDMSIESSVCENGYIPVSPHTNTIDLELYNREELQDMYKLPAEKTPRQTKTTSNNAKVFQPAEKKQNATKTPSPAKDQTQSIKSADTRSDALTKEQAVKRSI